MKTKQFIFTIVALMLMFPAFAQENIYHPKADARADIDAAVRKAKQENKHVFIQVGGNWCSWCIKFYHFVHEDQEIADFLDQNYVYVKLNYSKENKNLDILKELGFPQRFGFPVFVILNEKGEAIHIQNSVFLEKDKSYDKAKVLDFLKGWNREALNPERYTK